MSFLSRIEPSGLSLRVRRGDRLLGGSIQMPNEALVSLIGMVGLDFIVVDSAQRFTDQAALRHHITAAAAVGIPTIVSIGALSEASLALDVGAAGVICPTVETVPEAEAAVSAVRYPPRRRRGFAPDTNAGGSHHYSETAGPPWYAEQPLVIVKIDSETATELAADIAAVDGIDLLFPVPAGNPVDTGGFGAEQASSGNALSRITDATNVRILSSCGDEETAATQFMGASQLVVYNIQDAITATLVRLASALPRKLVAAVPPSASTIREPLVLLSGMLGDATLWDDVASELEDIAQPSFPRIDRDTTISEIAQSVLVTAPGRFALAGHSLGGIVALEIIRLAPERITRIALLNTSGREASPEQLTSWSAMASKTTAGHFRDVVADLGIHTLPTAHRSVEMVARNSAMASTVRAEGFLRQLAAQSSRPNFLPTLVNIRVPTLVVTGGLDQICPGMRQEELVHRIQGARHVTLRSAGHMSPLEAPHEVVAALRDWLMTP